MSSTSSEITSSDKPKRLDEHGEMSESQTGAEKGIRLAGAGREVLAVFSCLGMGGGCTSGAHNIMWVTGLRLI